MKNIFYLNLLKTKLEQKCSVEKFAKGFARPTDLGTQLILDCDGQVFRNKQAVKRKLVFFDANFAIKLRFSRDLFVQSFLLNHQKGYVNFAQKYRESFKMLQNINFCTLFILKSQRGGFLVRAAGLVCFLPKRDYMQIFSKICMAHFSTCIKYKLHTLLLFLVKICLKVGAGLRTFSALCGKVCFRPILKAKLIFNKALLSNKLSFKQSFYSVPTGENQNLNFRFKLSASYFKKKFLKKKRT